MSKFMSRRFDSLEEYVPGEQPQDKKYIKLNTNESPFPPSPEVIKAVNTDEVKDLRLYSDPEAKLLKKAIADYEGVKPENVFVSNGSDETLNFFFMAFCDSEKEVAFPNISYGFYKVFAELYSLKYDAVPLNEDFTINHEDYKSIGKNVVIANPNAPTGILLETYKIEEIIASNPNHVVVIDEAYVDFGGESAVELTKKYDNLLVVKTFSKSRSLAGARLGYGISDSKIISDLEKIKYSTNPYNVNRLTLKAGEASIKDTKYFEKTRTEIIKNREYITKELEALGFTVLNSKANFVFARHEKISGIDYYKYLRENGILVRHFTSEKICEYNRISIGTFEDMQKLAEVTKKLLEEIK